jgi:hypothetical protein
MFFAVAANLFSAFSPEKSRVKPENHLNNTNKTRSSWHFSLLQPVILKTDKRKMKAKSPGHPPGLIH